MATAAKPDWNDRSRSYINGAKLLRIRIREAQLGRRHVTGRAA